MSLKKLFFNFTSRNRLLYTPIESAKPRLLSFPGSHSKRIAYIFDASIAAAQPFFAILFALVIVLIFPIELLTFIIHLIQAAMTGSFCDNVAWIARFWMTSFLAYMYTSRWSWYFATFQAFSARLILLESKYW